MMKIAVDNHCLSRMSVKFRRHPAVRLRRESWGGLAFHQNMGELLELDHQAFEILAALSSAATLQELAAIVRSGVSHLPRLPELARFLRELNERGFVERVPINTDRGRRPARCGNTADIPEDRSTSTTTSKRGIERPAGRPLGGNLSLQSGVRVLLFGKPPAPRARASLRYPSSNR